MDDKLLDIVPALLRPAVRRSWHVVSFHGLGLVDASQLWLRAWRANTLSGHLSRKRLTDRRPLLTKVADKLAARDYISEHVGSDYLPTLLDSATAAKDVAWDDLPREFAAKVNHASGGVVLVTNDAPANAKLPAPGSLVTWCSYRVRPEKADRLSITDLFGHWLTLDYSRNSGRIATEWCYQDIPRKVMVEELLRDSDGDPPREYRLFVIGGRVRFIQAEIVESDRSCTAVMTPSWEALHVRFLNPLPRNAPDRPKALTEMIDVAQALGRPLVDFLRVDLYDLGSRLIVGELTNYPYGGRLPVRPRSFDKQWARYWPQTP